jgi:hypothetical protein
LVCAIHACSLTALSLLKCTRFLYASNFMKKEGVEVGNPHEKGVDFKF